VSHLDSPPAGDPSTVALATAAEAWALDEDAPLLVPALEDLGVRAVPARWDDPSVDWGAHDLVVVRSTWDYAQRPVEFLQWTRRVEALTRLANPAAVVEWNLDKHYLGQLAADGVPVVPTTYLEPGADADEVGRALSVHGDVVVKPTISAGSKDTTRHGAQDRAAAVSHATQLLRAGRSVMVQPYLDSVDRDGETGMVLFDGALSHAFRKGQLLHSGAAPADGLFAPERISPRNAELDERRLASRVLDAALRRLGVDRLLYARVDVIRDGEGRPTLLELELVEPSFFLETDPAAAGRAARAIASAAWAARRS
jgi:glutathione synthase/RimK-type ligase-like ATP-grasp enzyme